MNLFVIRHTSVDVEPGICYGQSDVVVVASTFLLEKEKVKSSIAEIPFDAVFSSPFFRCKTLAESLIQKDKIVFDDRLKELNFGEWELKIWDAIYNSPKGKVWMDNYQTLPTLNGESYPEMVERISLFYSELNLKEYENVAIFTHAGVIRILKSIVEKQSIDELFTSFNPEYGSISKFKI